jgi:hypothetical protein
MLRGLSQFVRSCHMQLIQSFFELHRMISASYCMYVTKYETHPVFIMIFYITKWEVSFIKLSTGSWLATAAAVPSIAINFIRLLMQGTPQKSNNPKQTHTE